MVGSPETVFSLSELRKTISQLPLIESKIKAIPLEPYYIQRSNIENPFNKPHTTLALVTAPAGTGKSILLSQWFHELVAKDEKVCWLSLSRDDNDPVRFFSYVIESLQKTEPYIWPDIDASYRRFDDEPSVSFLRLAEQLIADLEEFEDPIYCFIDDFHLVESPIITAAISLFLAHMPSNVHLCIASRHQPQLSVGRYRSKGKLSEHKYADLKFSAEQSRQLLDAIEAPVKPQKRDDLINALDGWTSGLVLASNALMHISPEDQLAIESCEEFFGHHQDFLSYFFDDAYKHLEDSTKRALKQLSVVENFSSQLYTSLSGNNESDAMMERLNAQQLFIEPIGFGQYKFHPLYRRFLHQRLMVDEPESLIQLHFSASMWFSTHNHSVAAIEHAFAARDYEMAASLISACVFDLLNQSYAVQLFDWIKQIPRDITLQYPRLQLVRIWVLIRDGYDQEAERALLRLMQQDEKHQPLGISEREAICYLLSILINLRNDDLDSANVSIHKVQPYFDELDPWLSAQFNILAAVILMLQGRPGECVDNISSAERFASELKGNFMNHLIGAIRAYHFYETGMLKAAKAEITKLENHKDVVGISEWYRLVNALLNFEGNKLQNAWDMLQDRRPVAEGMIQSSFLQARLYAVRSRLVSWFRDEESGLDELERLLNHYKQRGQQRAWRICRAAQAQLLMDHGRFDRAEWCLAQEGVLPQIGISPYLSGYGWVIVARSRVAWHKQSINELRAIFDLLGHDVERDDGVSRSGTENLLSAMYHWLDENKEAAMTFFRNAIIAASEQGYLRALAELPEALLVFIEASKNSGLFHDPDLIAYVEKLEKAIHAKQMTGQFELDDQQVSLTGREKQILELAADGLSNQEISDRIFVSLGTVKWHLHNVYDKLGVKNRTQALKAVQEFQKVS